jgi:hypothetical protein
LEGKEMEVKQNLVKTWQDVRDQAAESSAIIHVVNAEQWAKKLAPLLSEEAGLSAEAVYSKCNTDLSGYQASYAYAILRCYWKHADLLVWQTFSEFLGAAKRQALLR